MRVLRPFRHLLPIAGLLMVLLSGCLTIEENYTFRKDGSGTMEYVVDMSAVAELMKGLEGLGDGKAKDAPSDAMDLVQDGAALKAIPGIRKVKIKKEKDGYVQRLRFAFKDLVALNAALNVLMPDSSGRPTEFFRWEGNTLVRTNNRHAIELGSDLAEEDADSTGNALAILESMQYKYSFTFARPVADAAVQEGMEKEAPNAKELRFGTNWSMITQRPEVLDLRITLNP